MADINYRDLHVLLMDDEAFMRTLVERVLKDMDVGMITHAENGLDGLEKLRQMHRKIDIVVCDLEMPEMNGLQFVEAVRKGGEEFDPNVPILILTGHADEQIVHNVVKLGINGYIVKPVSRTALEKRMIAALSQSANGR